MSKGLFARFGKQVYKEILKGNAGILGTLKYYFQWKRSLKPGRSSIVDEQPWITYPAITLLKQYTKADSRVFEYGGGGSTLFFVNRAKEVVTVEHDNHWFTILQQKIRDKNVHNWFGHLILPEKKNNQNELDPADPQHYFSNDEAFLDSTFKSYASSIDKYPNNYFDIILVDGRARPSCTWHSLVKVKPGGLLIVDNSNRSYYFTKIINDINKDYKLVFDNKALSPYVDFLTQTSVWRKL